jgi:KaiC/GvpD/RAD55 family RecA-like ATPase
MCVSQNDLMYLIVNVNNSTDDQVNKYVEKNINDLTIKFNKIEEEYRAITFDKKELSKQKELARMIYLESQHNAIVKVLNLYIETNEILVLDILNELGCKFDKSNDINKQLKSANRVIMNLKNKINILNSNFKIKYKITDKELKEDKVTSVTGIEKSLDSQALMLEGNLETGYRIDIKTTSVLRWVNLLETNKSKLAKQNF